MGSTGSSWASADTSSRVHVSPGEDSGMWVRSRVGVGIKGGPKVLRFSREMSTVVPRTRSGKIYSAQSTRRYFTSFKELKRVHYRLFVDFPQSFERRRVSGMLPLFIYYSLQNRELHF